VGGKFFLRLVNDLTQKDLEKIKECKDLESVSMCGIDTGVRTKANIFSHKDGITEVIEFGNVINHGEHVIKKRKKNVTPPSPPWKQKFPKFKGIRNDQESTALSTANLNPNPTTTPNPPINQNPPSNTTTSDKKDLKKLRGSALVNAFRIRQMQSMVDKSKNLTPSEDGYMTPKQRSNYRRRMRLLHARLRNIRDDAHHKIIKYLIDNFRVVFIPKLPVSQMTKRKGRKLAKATVAQMLDWSHALFLKRLLDKAKNSACSVIQVDESYTSKTCCSCGKINEGLGSKKEFKCPYCLACMDRDANGSKNILVRSIASFLDFIIEEDALCCHAGCKVCISQLEISAHIL
jgi:IS605 OrfB family transposase